MARVTGPHFHTVNIGSFADSSYTGQEFLAFRNFTGEMIHVLSAYVSVKATAHSTTYWNIRLRNTDGNNIVTKALSSGTYITSSPITMGTVDEDYAYIDDDENIYVRIDHQATGVNGQTLTGLAVVFEYEFVNTP